MLNTHVSNKVRYFSSLFIALYLLIVSYSIETLHWGDDATFLAIANQTNFNILDWLYNRYFEWSGRVTIEFLMLGTINYPAFWKILIPLTMLLMATSISNIIFNEVKAFAVLLILVLMAISPVEIISESTYWVTGFYNYLLPLSLGLYCFSILIKKAPSRMSMVFSFFSVFIFAYQEQVVVLFLLACVCVPNFYKDKFKLALIFFVIVNAAVLFLAPGNANRLLISYWGAFPQYLDFGLPEQLALGFDKLYQGFIFPDNWPLFIFLGMLCGRYFFINRYAVSEKISLVVLVFFMAFFLAHAQEFPFSSQSFAKAQYIGEINSDAIIGGKMYVWYFAFLLVLVSSLILILRQLTSFGVQILIVLSLGIASVMMMGFSPTVYSSTYRVQLIFEVSLIMAILFQFRTLKEEYENVQELEPGST
ncbi:hypothetical protein [Marinomonas ostreistagni]|uniref:Uncharacterized protein n=1 Tax=Marinomonas ostreistagni TaxID=359209 RepID=A0ABS0Z9M4_9GAMM|nr:hypothetical protein [Marinomonas ostreistagni]MBJ7550359.1 hypothetical protein [Marinomonas ostreistagni]